MKGLIISDREYPTAIFDDIKSQVLKYLVQKSCQIQEFQIGRDNLAACMGCFGCWTKKPGECVIDDGISDINRTAMSCDIVVFICPLIFGQFSANIKNVIDRWLPNILPYFITRKDGSTMHSARYADYPRQIMIGYNQSLSDVDARIFEDITKKHRNNVDVLIWRGDASRFGLELNKIGLQRVEGRL